MKFLLDGCISSFAVKDLKDSGFDVLWIPEIGKDPGDEAIIKKALITVERFRVRVRTED